METLTSKLSAGGAVGIDSGLPTEEVSDPGVALANCFICRLCERMDCEQGAFPPLHHPLKVNENVRGVAFYAPVE